MRLLMPALCAALIASPVAAQQVVLPPSDANVKNIVPAKNAVIDRVAEWQDGGAIRIALGKDADAAPATASKYEQKRFIWPTGEMRVLHFKKGTPVLHQVTFETEMYVVEGTAEVGVNGKPVKIGPGDAVFMPSGALTNKKLSGDLTVVLWNVGVTSKDPKAKLVRGADVKSTSSASWVENGKSMNANKPEDLKKAPPTAARWSTKRYEFDGNSIRVATFAKSGRSGDGKSTTDALIYVAKGKLGRQEGEEKGVLEAGDGLREQTGLSGYWEGLDNSIFIATSAPMPAGFAPTKPIK